MAKITTIRNLSYLAIVEWDSESPLLTLACPVTPGMR